MSFISYQNIPYTLIYQYINKKYWNNPSMLKLVQLLTSNKKHRNNTF